MKKDNDFSGSSRMPRLFKAWMNGQIYSSMEPKPLLEKHPDSARAILHGVSSRDSDLDKYKSFSIEKSAKEKLSLMWKRVLKVSIFLVAIALLLIILSGQIEAGVLPFIIVYILISLYFVERYFIYSKYRKMFWEMVASAHDWIFGQVYETREPLFTEVAAQSRYISVNRVEGKFKDVKFRIIESLDKKFLFTAFVFDLDKKFPHCYLNRKDNKYNRIRELIPLVTLPTEVSKLYELHVPKKYEIELLQIFNPVTLSYLLDNNINYDIELYDHTLIIVRNNRFDSVEEFELEINKIERLYNKMKDDLNNFSYSEIGDLSPLLAKVKIDQHKWLYRPKRLFLKITDNKNLRQIILSLYFGGMFFLLFSVLILLLFTNFTSIAFNGFRVFIIISSILFLSAVVLSLLSKVLKS